MYCKRCCGSAYGWMAIVGLYMKLELINPITKACLHNFPPLTTMPDLTEKEKDEEDPFTPEWFLFAAIRRAIVLKMPREEDDFVVMAINGLRESLTFARPGDQAWASVLTPSGKPDRVADVFYWKRDGLVLIMYKDGSLAYCDLNSDLHTGAPVKAKDYLPGRNEIFAKVVHFIGDLYMAELEGELIVVSRYKKETVDEADVPGNLVHGHLYCTKRFEVHKLDYETKLWKTVDDLGDYLLFVGNNTAVSVHVSKAPNCQRNAIYFTDDEIDFWGCLQPTRGEDMGVFDMSSGEIVKFYQGDDAISERSIPSWFIPMF